MKHNSVWYRLTVILVLFGLVAMVGCSAAEQTFTGTMEQTDKGLVLKTSDGTESYRVVDTPDMRALAGKTVKLMGSLLDRQSGKSINVKSFEVLE